MCQQRGFDVFGQEIETLVNRNQHKQTREPVSVPQVKYLMVHGPLSLTLSGTSIWGRCDNVSKIAAYGGQTGGRDSDWEHDVRLFICIGKVVLERLGWTRAQGSKVMGDVLRD
jgi:hypothetical protein